MLNSLAIKFLSTLLVFALWSTTLTLVLHQTILNSHYLEGRLDAIHGYDRLSGALTDEIAHTPDLAANPEIAAKIKPILTPTVLKTKLNSALDQMQAYYLHGGPQPVIDLSDLAAQAQAAGIPIPRDSSLNQKIILGGSKQGSDQTQTKAQNVGSIFNKARISSGVASIILAIAVLGLSLKQRRYTALPIVLITVGVLIALLAVFLSMAPSVLDRYVKIGTSSNAFALLGHDLVGNVASNLGMQFGIVAVVYLVVGISARVLASRLQAKPQLKQSTAKAK